MFILVERATRQVLDASDIVPWPVHDETQGVVEVPGVTETAYAWPGGERTRCTCAADGTIGYSAALDRDAVRDAYLAAKAATEDFAADSTLAKARTAIIRQGQCLEALLLYLNKRIS